MWVTPCATDAKPITGGNLYQTTTGTVRHLRPDGKSSNRGLEAQVMWPTPQARDHFPPHTPEYIQAKKSQGHGMSNLNDTVAHCRMWPTATATQYKGWSQGHNRADKDDRLDYTVEREAYQAGQPTPPMRLNPAWVEWLMGWPIGWTDLKPLAMARFRAWWQQHAPR